MSIATGSCLYSTVGSGIAEVKDQAESGSCTTISELP